MPLFIKDGRQVLFVHIPKCAGTSIEHILAEISDISLLVSDSPCAMLPCTPQHSHVDILREQIPGLSDIDSFAVVRHPLLRVISEHQYRNKLRQRRKERRLEFSEHLNQFFFEYRFDNLVFDNHIRPQVEFIFPNIRVFRLESGLLPALEYAFGCLGQKLSGQILEEQSRKNVSQYEDFLVSGNDIDKVQDFYSLDFEIFGYKKLDIPQGTNIRHSEILLRLKEPFAREYCYSQQLLATYQNKKKEMDNDLRVAKIVSATRYATKQAYRLMGFLKNQ